MPQKIQCFLYHSELDPAASVVNVQDIVREARSFNKTHQITGMLMFDGLRFVQYIEDETDKLELLISKISNDPRHTNITSQYNALHTSERLFPNWSMGYVLLEGDDHLGAITPLRGEMAMQKLGEMLPELDFW